MNQEGLEKLHIFILHFNRKHNFLYENLKKKCG